MRKKTKNRGLSLILAMVILATTIITPAQGAVAATSSKIKIYNFIKLTVQALDLEIDNTFKSPYLNAALKAGIVKEGDFSSYTKYTTRTDAAVILNRADEYLYGDTVSEKLLNTVLEKRISDISKIAKDKREAVAKIYAKGFVKGYSNGSYVQSREFRGSDYMTTAGSKNLISMLKNTKKRASLSPDGLLIRTTNLPSNAKDFEYILECFPNSFYEMKFRYQNTKYYYEPTELVDYASPVKIKDVNLYSVDLNKYKDTWIERIEKNLESRLIVDYRTINNTWFNTLRATYTQHGHANSDKRISDPIKNYIDVVKKNKIVIQSKVISVEPSSLYMSGAGFYVRAYIQFKVSYSGTKLTAQDLIFGDYIYMSELKKDTWYEGVYDIQLGTVNGSSNGSDYYVTNDSLNDYFYKGER